MDSFRDLVFAHEHDLVRDTFADQLLSQHVAVPPSIRQKYEYRLRVQPKVLGLPESAFGDADAVLIESGVPERASAIEFKRVKITASSFATDQINKLAELPKAVTQANRLHAAGFAFAWLTVVVVADTRSLTDGAGYGAIPGKLIQAVLDAIPAQQLADGVGLTVCEIVQVSDEPANFRGMSGGQLRISAKEQKQPKGLTDAVSQLFAPAS